jgi:hypothetical protein
MIYASLFDAGTELRRQPADVPGCDTAWWTDAHFEESIFEYRKRSKTLHQNEKMRDADPMEIRPWPEPMPGKMWVDHTARYTWNGLDGLSLNLYHVDRIAGDFPPLPAGAAQLITNPKPEVDRAEGRTLRELTWREVRDAAETPTDWYRLDTLNESQGTQLTEPLALIVPEARGSIALEMVNQSLFDPFDLRKGTEWYRATDDNGEAFTGDVSEYLYLYPRGRYNLYFRPRRWRYYVVVYAVFIYISFFELFPVTTAFTHAWYDTAPRYPIRHNILNTNPGSTDPAILWQFEHSQAAADLTHQIFEAQWWTPCEAFIFSSIELVQMWVYREAPRKYENVLGIGRVDQATGRESRVWIQNLNDRDDDYPREEIAFFEQVPWYILPPGSEGIF